MCGNSSAAVGVGGVLSYVLKFSRDETFVFFAVQKTTANSLIREYFEQVLQNHKKMNAKRALAPFSPLYWIGSTNTDKASLDNS